MIEIWAENIKFRTFIRLFATSWQLNFKESPIFMKSVPVFNLFSYYERIIFLDADYTQLPAKLLRAFFDVVDEEISVAYFIRQPH